MAKWLTKQWSKSHFGTQGRGRPPEDVWLFGINSGSLVRPEKWFKDAVLINAS
jgi:hypothetical protein